MNRQKLIEIIRDQGLEQPPSSIVPRKEYENISDLLDNKQIIIISGIRRCGKSTLMQMIRNNMPEKDYYINFDDDRLVKFTLEDFDTLIDAFVELFGAQTTYYFDEIQNILGWERFVRRLHNQGTKIFITGSNASLLSSELGTHLTGRNIPIKLYPYSFKEYLYFKDKNLLEKTNKTSTDFALIKKAFAEFRIDGGLPEYLENMQKQYLHSLYDNILYKDIIVRNKISQERPIKELVYYLASNNTKEFSYNSVKKIIGIASTTTVSEYCQYLENSFLCFTINKFSYSVKQQISSTKKIYFIDQALAMSVGFHFSPNEGRMLENIVFLQLLRLNKEVFFHKEKQECDFVIREGYHITQAIQVTLHMEEEKTKTREINGLLEALSTYKLERGLIITQDLEDTLSIEYNDKLYEISIVPCWKWLLETES